MSGLKLQAGPMQPPYYRDDYISNKPEVRRIIDRWHFFVNQHRVYECKADYPMGKNIGVYVENKQKINMNYIKASELFFIKN